MDVNVFRGALSIVFGYWIDPDFFVDKRSLCAAFKNIDSEEEEEEEDSAVADESDSAVADESDSADESCKPGCGLLPPMDEKAPSSEESLPKRTKKSPRNPFSRNKGNSKKRCTQSGKNNSTRLLLSDESDFADESLQLLSQREKRRRCRSNMDTRKKAQETQKQNTTPHTDAARETAKRIVSVYLDELAAEGSFVSEPRGGSSMSPEFLEHLTQKITRELNQFGLTLIISHESQPKEQTPHVSRNESCVDPQGEETHNKPISAEDIERPKKRVRHVDWSSQPSVKKLIPG